MWQEATLKILHESGVKTFASFEPTIEPRESLALIERTLQDNSVDHYKIGKINHYKNADGWQDWRQYLLDCLALLRPTGKEVYYKFYLRKFVPDVELMPEEKPRCLYRPRNSFGTVEIVLSG